MTQKDTSSLLRQVASFPRGPGIYIMKDAKGVVIYVGKAKNLQARVKSYFKKESESRYQVKFLMKRVKTIENVVTATEKEALLLEQTTIKKQQPRYNLMLRDDKSYLSVMLSLQDEFPRIYVTRRIKKDKNLYFGPYTSGQACRETVDFLERYFQLRTCSDHELHNRSRPCIQYQIKRCPAPCVGLISQDRYRAFVDSARLFLQGKNGDLAALLKKEMKEASGLEDYERAAKIRDLLKAFEQTLEKQVVIRHKFVDQDYIGLYREEAAVTITILRVRQGTVLDTRTFHQNSLDEEDKMMESILLQAYPEAVLIPREICLAVLPTSKKVVEEILTERRQTKVMISLPRQGERRQLLALASRNAEEAFKRHRHQTQTLRETLQRLQDKLGLKNLPNRMECYDISNTQGKNPVGSGVCFVQGKPAKSFYRRYKIRGEDEPNDYRMMSEVLSRRLKLFQYKIPSPCWGEGQGGGEGESLPDLIVIDGGKGQLAVVEKIFEELGVINIDLIALAKRNEGEAQDKIFLCGRANPVLLKPNDPSLLLLMQIRDEAHRFAVKYHRHLRAKHILPKAGKKD